MRIRVGGSIVAIALISAVAGAAGVLAGEDAAGPGQVPDSGELRKVEAIRVAAPRADGGVARLETKPQPPKPPERKPTLVYLETPPQTLAAGPAGFRVGDCPPRAKAINGYYYVNGTQTGFGLDAQGDSPIRGLRQWAFYLDSTAGANNVTFGLICLKNVK